MIDTTVAPADVTTTATSDFMAEEVRKIEGLNLNAEAKAAAIRGTELAEMAHRTPGGPFLVSVGLNDTAADVADALTAAILAAGARAELDPGPDAA